MTDRRIGDHELGRDLAHRRGLGEDAVTERRAAECDDDVTLAACQFGELVGDRPTLPGGKESRTTAVITSSVSPS